MIPRSYLIWLGLALSFTPTACTVGPNYLRPSLAKQLPTTFDLPAGWKLAEPGDEKALEQWWQRFNDPQLNRLIEQAGTNNQDLAAAFHRVEQSRAVSRSARAAWLPTANFEPSANRSKRSGTTSNTASNLAGITTSNFALPLVLDYEIDLWGKIRRGIEASEAEILASESALRQVRLAVQTELAAQYYELRSRDAEIAIFEKAVGLRKKSLDLNRKRFDAGDTDEVDVSRAETELSATESELIGLRQARDEIENAIAVLVGSPSSGFKVAAKPLTGSAPKIPASVPTDLLERRPDIAAAERIMIAENARIGVAKAAFYPSLRLMANGGLESGDISNLFKSNSRTWGLGPELSLPVFEGGRNKANLARSEARYDETVADYRQTILQAVREVDDAFTAITRLSQRAAAQQRTVNSATRTVELSESRYQAGVVDYFEVVDAQRTELDAEQQAVFIQLGRHLAAISLIRALGGDW